MRRVLAGCVVVLMGLPVWGADWPNWLGPNRNGSSPETGLLVDWPKDGPKVLWKAPGGEGYSAVVVAKGKAVTLVQRNGGEAVLALDAAKGTKLWETKIAPAYKNQYGNGPRSTPTFEGDFVYVQSVSGPLVCLDAAKGDIVWSVDLLKEFGAKNISWGLSASPVVDGDLVLAIPGGKGAGVVALNKKDGKLAWKLGDDKAAYATPVAMTVAGQKQLLFFTASGLLAVSPAGKELWRVTWETEYDCNICTPLVIGDTLFVTSGEGVGSALYRLSASGPPEMIWESKGKKGVMTNFWANSVVQDGYLYGLNGEFSERIQLNCVELKTGKLMWSQKEFGKGGICLADGHLFMTTKAGDVVLARATPEKYEEKARFTLLGDNRTVPTISDRRMYLRDKENIYCLEVAK